jgi:hypothetical protein
MPKGINADGTPKTRPANAGKAPKPNGKKKTFMLSEDVLAILKKSKNLGAKNATDLVEKALRYYE